MDSTCLEMNGRAYDWLAPCMSLPQFNTECCIAHVVNQTADKPYYLFDGYAHLAAGLACGLAGLAAGMAIGIVGDAGVRSVLLRFS